MQKPIKDPGRLAMKEESKTKVGRRDFLRVLGVGAGAAVTPAALVSEAEADTENNAEKTKARYKANSEHIKAFYRVNGYPS
jgi:hypothetical protein